jgi:SAM-dependent methyltransferase
VIARFKAAVKALLGHGASASTSLGYLSAKKTVAAARREGRSVCDYVEELWNQRGDTQKVIDQMASLGLLDGTRLNILEIGAGTGRYLEKILQRCRPGSYEVYETATDWRKWLQSTYPILAHDADGATLGRTGSASIDLLHAHGVFVYLPLLVSWRYFHEISRVMKLNGAVVFDIYSEDVVDEKAIDKWLSTDHWNPCLLPKNRVISTFQACGFKLIKAFRHPYGGGESEYLVFRRTALEPLSATTTQAPC